MSEMPMPSQLEAAALWRMRVNDAPPDHPVHDELEAWLKQDERHVIALGMVSQSWQALKDHAQEASLLDMRREALGRLHEANSRARLRRRRWAVRAIAASIALATIGGIYTLLPQHPVHHPQSFATGADERRTFELADGSTLILDRNSQVRVDISPDIRGLTLERGRARFQVSHDASRPFQVYAGHLQVTAHGTDFVVELYGGLMTAGLLRGKIGVQEHSEGIPSQIATALDPAPEVMLAPGQQLREISPKKFTLRSNVAPDIMTAWQSGKISFDAEPILDAIEEINRGSPVKVKLDVGLEDLQVSGVFDAQDGVAFAQAVAELLNLDLDRSGKTVLLTRSGGAAVPAPDIR